MYMCRCSIFVSIFRYFHFCICFRCFSVSNIDLSPTDRFYVERFLHSFINGIVLNTRILFYDFRICCVENPVPSQVIIAKTISKPDKIKSVTEKIALQMNCKLGGALWALKNPFVRLNYHELKSISV